MSVCSGAFALAATGLLDGRPAMTHWRVSDQLQRRCPSIEVQPNRMFVDDGDILTSAGVTAGIDLCLHLIRIDHGAAAFERKGAAGLAHLGAPLSQRDRGLTHGMADRRTRRPRANCWKPPRSPSNGSGG
ncbi:DJ-1/PfpI family protein [Streptomyces hokutonensis]|uniref:DJ-1/PfpI family protein n=1 Tax=Streptomyces hokutonensis TaxID=1306990 RepID=A0ABW6M6C5_9ACTN